MDHCISNLPNTDHPSFLYEGTAANQNFSKL